MIGHFGDALFKWLKDNLFRMMFEAKRCMLLFETPLRIWLDITEMSQLSPVPRKLWPDLTLFSSISAKWPPISSKILILLVWDKQMPNLLNLSICYKKSLLLILINKKRESFFPSKSQNLKILSINKNVRAYLIRIMKLNIYISLRLSDIWFIDIWHHNGN